MSYREKIPVRNIWLLFLYAADLVTFKGRFDHEAEDARDLPELLARLLASSVELRLRRNLNRGYILRSADLTRVRGRIDVLATETRQLIERGAVRCVFGEHTMNIPRNRFVRAALDALSRRVKDGQVAGRCRAMSAAFERQGVGSQRPSRAEMAVDQIGRNEAADRFMVGLAKMVFDASIPTEIAGRHAGTHADAEDHLVRRLFERAVGNALRLELVPKGWSVFQGRHLSWPLEEQSDGLTTVLPGMKTDIELQHTGLPRRIIIDTKFTDIFASSQHRDYILKSGHLYQIYAYLRTQERPEDKLSLVSEGLLLHPVTGGSVDETMKVNGHVIRFKTIDLMLPPFELEASLRDLVELR